MKKSKFKGVDFYIFLGFAFVVPVGTFLHECGHLLMAKMLGCTTTFHFGSVESENCNSSGKELWILLAGPVSTILFSLLGCYLAYRVKEKITSNQIPLKKFIACLLALFISRELFIGIKWMFYRGISINSDEYKITKMMGLNEEWVPIILIIFSTLICLWIVKISVAKEFLARFILAGILGCGVGFILWMRFLGPIILP